MKPHVKSWYKQLFCNIRYLREKGEIGVGFFLIIFGSELMPPQSKARNGAQSDLLAQLLSSLGILKTYEILFNLKGNCAGIWEKLSCFRNLNNWSSKSRNSAQSDLLVQLLCSLWIQESLKFLILNKFLLKLCKIPVKTTELNL